MYIQEAIDVLVELADTYLTNSEDISPEYRTLVLKAMEVAEDDANA